MVNKVLGRKCSTVFMCLFAGTTATAQTTNRVLILVQSGASWTVANPSAVLSGGRIVVSGSSGPSAIAMANYATSGSGAYQEEGCVPSSTAAGSYSVPLGGPGTGSGDASNDTLNTTWSVENGNGDYLNAAPLDCNGYLGIHCINPDIAHPYTIVDASGDYADLSVQLRADSRGGELHSVSYSDPDCEGNSTVINADGATAWCRDVLMEWELSDDTIINCGGLYLSTYSDACSSGDCVGVPSAARVGRAADRIHIRGFVDSMDTVANCEVVIELYSGSYALAMTGAAPSASVGVSVSVNGTPLTATPPEDNVSYYGAEPDQYVSFELQRRDRVAEECECARAGVELEIGGVVIDTNGRSNSSTPLRFWRVSQVSTGSVVVLGDYGKLGTSGPACLEQAGGDCLDFERGEDNHINYLDALVIMAAAGSSLAVEPQCYIAGLDVNVNGTIEEAEAAAFLCNQMADINMDDFVDFFDYADFVDAYLYPCDNVLFTADMNQDGIVDFFDLDLYTLVFDGRSCGTNVVQNCTTIQ